MQKADGLDAAKPTNFGPLANVIFLFKIIEKLVQLQCFNTFFKASMLSSQRAFYQPSRQVFTWPLHRNFACLTLRSHTGPLIAFHSGHPPPVV